MKLFDDFHYVGVNDHQVDLFEGQYVVPNGMSYNSYVIVDEKVAVMIRWIRISPTNGWIISIRFWATVSPIT